MLWRNFFNKAGLSLVTGLLSWASVHSVMAADPAQDPLFLTQPVRPIMMLNMSNDHQLFFKLYDDYSDLDGDGNPDTSYNHDYDYFGYFDSQKCYSYDDTNDRFEPSSWVDANGFCNTSTSSEEAEGEDEDDGNGEWSGNFLNWASMTRMDAVRKILYGGKRDVDTASETVLERAMLPHDAHAFAKYYNGPDIAKLTPFNVNTNQSATTDTGITICNTTDGSGLSQDVTAPPLMKVAQGNFSLWASNERWQCRWGVANNGNDPATTGIFANGSSPDREGDGLGEENYEVRVQTCVAGWIDDVNNEGCQAYGSSQKPTGLLQTYGENDAIHFGLLTGSYDRNKSGGVLRKNVGNIRDEINLDNGTFVVPAAEDVGDFNGVISTLDKLRIYGYRFDNGTYHRGNHAPVDDGSDACVWGNSSFVDGHCSNWGNPQTEIFLESLRYLAGLQPTSDFLADDSDRLEGLNTATWEQPVTNDNFCAPLNVIQFNASTSSYDGDNLGGASDLGYAGDSGVDAATSFVGANEGIHGNRFFVGEILGGAGSETNQLCTAKTINNLAYVRGTCPDAPRLEGSYEIAGLASLARTQGIPLTGVNQPDQTVRTYGVALAPAVPSVTIPVPGSEGQTVNIQPACRTLSTNPQSNCAIVDFKIIEQEQVNVNGSTAQVGKLYVNWEDSEQGGDFDQDMWGVMDYQITSLSATVTTQVIAQSSGDRMGFGYVISGTTEDGFKVHSGINNFVFGDFCTENGTCTCSAGTGTQTCTLSAPTTQTYNIGSSSARPLEQPLYYAAKWGGFAEDGTSVEDIASSEPETFFFATDPRKLEESLRTAFASVAASVGSAASVATNSTRLTEGSFVYQARFNSEDWSGEIRAFEIDENNNIEEAPSGSTDNTMSTGPNTALARNLVTFTDGQTVDFEWDELNDAQRDFLDGDADDEALGIARLNWLRGDDSNETATGGLRERSRLLGDVVNSSPVLLSGRDLGYSRLSTGGDSYQAHVDAKRAQVPTLFVGANDGMLHAFKADGPNLLDERFAFVPDGVYPKLAKLTDPDYGRQDLGHEFTVDGPVAVGDAFLNGDWESVLVGTLGAGGKGVFALDVTNPDDPQVLFELNGTQDPSLGLGFVLGRPFVVPMADGSWAAVFGNGYDSGTSKLFVVDLETGDARVIDTEAGTGLSGIELLPDANGVIQAAYAGDLEGNMWKFDLSSANPSQWDVAFKQGSTPKPLFKAMDANDRPQPITGAPTLGLNAQKDNAVMVYFGTGKYFEDSDNSVDSSDAQNSFYAVADTGVALTGDRDNILHEKELNQNGNDRTINNADVDWTQAEIKGWFLDFDTDMGERVVVKPILRFDRLIFPTLIPSAIPCQFGGRSWLMELIAVGDRFIGEDLLGENSLADSLILGEPTFGIVDIDTGKVITSRSDGELDEKDTEIPESALGRQSWRQLR